MHTCETPTGFYPCRFGGCLLFGHGEAGPTGLLSSCYHSFSPVEAPAPPELLGGPEDVAEPLMQCAAWLDAYFHKPALLTELPLPALHHPVFQQGQLTQPSHMFPSGSLTY